MESPKKVDLRGVHGAEAFRDLQEGTRLLLTDGSIAEITGNPRDGAMLMIRIVESPVEGRVGSEETVFFEDVKDVA